MAKYLLYILACASIATCFNATEESTGLGTSGYLTDHPTNLTIRDPPQCDEESQNRYTSLICWLYDLKLQIPDEKISKGLISIRIHDMICSKFQVSHTESNYLPGNDDDQEDSIDPKIDVKVFGMSIQCEGKYKAALAGGTVTVVVDNIGDKALHIQTAIGSTFIQQNDTDANAIGNDIFSTVDSSPFQAPSRANVTACSTNLQVPEDGGISFSGSISAKFVELFSGSIANHVTSALNSQICPQVKTAVNKNFTKVLIKLDSFLGHLIYDNTDYEEHIFRNSRALGELQGLDMRGGLYGGYKDDTDLIQWDELITVKKLVEQLNNFIKVHLDKGILLDVLDRIGWPHSNDSASPNCVDCGYFFRGVNGLMKNITSDGQLTIGVNRELNFTIKDVGDINLTLRNITIGGLDEFTLFGILPQHPRDIMSRVMMNYLTLGAGVNLKLFPTPGGHIRGKPLEESFGLNVNASGLLLDAPLNLGIIRDKMREVTIGDMNKHHWRRILPALRHILIGKMRSKMVVESLIIDPLEVTDNLEKSLDAMLNNIITLTLREYEETVSRTIEASLSGPLVRAINKAFSKIIKNGTSVWSMRDDYLSEDVPNDFFRFNESRTVRRLHDYFSSQRFVGKMNTYIDCISSYLKDNPLRSRSAFFGFNSFSFQGVDLDNIEFLKSLDASHVECDFDANGNGTSTQLTSVLGFDLDYPQKDLRAAITLHSYLSGLGGRLGSNILFNMTEYMATNLYDMVSGPTKSMLKPLSLSSGMYGIMAFVDDLNVNVNVSLTENKGSREVLFNSTAEDNFGGIVTGYIKSSTKLIQNLLNGMKLIFISSDSNCHNPQERVRSKVGSSPLTQWIVCIFCVFICVNFLFYATKNRKIRDEVVAIDPTRNLSNSMPKQKTILPPKSLIFHDKVSHTMRIMIPLAIVATVVIFMVSNFSVGAWVDIKISKYDGTTIAMIHDVTDFSLGKTVTDMYHAKVYTLMTLVLVFSGIWPYVKLLLMLVSWISPESIISFETKEWLLIMLDALGKYSLVDSFVLVLMLVSFKFHIDFPGIGFIDSYVIPAFGFYLFLLATVLSLIIGHGVTFLHRFTKLPTINRSNHRQALRHHEFHFIDSIGGVRFAKLSPLAQKCWAFITVACTIFLCIGSTNKSFTFVFQGLLGDILGDDRSASYSLWTLGISLPLSVENPQNFGVTLIQTTFFFFALVMPFACLLTITVLFYIPMTLRGQQIVFMLAEIANAWSAIEVFLLSVLASMLELSQFAAFMVGDHCDFLKTKFFFDLFQNDTCFSVESKVNFGVIYLCTGVALYNLIVFIGLRLAHDALEERILRENIGRAIADVDSNHGKPTLVSRLMKWKITRGFVDSQISG